MVKGFQNLSMVCLLVEQSVYENLSMYLIDDAVRVFVIRPGLKDFSHAPLMTEL